MPKILKGHSANLLFAVAAMITPWVDFSRPAIAAGNGQLVLTVVDRDTHEPIACRMHLRRANGRPWKVKGLPYWHDHFVFDGRVALRLPKGDYTFELEHGLEYVTRSGRFTIEPFADDAKEVDMRRFVDMSEHGWWSGDLDVRRPVSQIELLMLADDLHVAAVERASNRKGAARVDFSSNSAVVRFDDNRFFSTAAAVHAWPGAVVSYFNLSEPLSLPAPTAEVPSPLVPLGQVRGQRGAWVDLTRATWWDLPLLVALGQIDSVRIANEQWCRDRVLDDPRTARPRDRKLFPDARGAAEWTQEVYFRLLECGLRIPPSAGSGSGASPNPVGYNRMYVHVDGPLDWSKWFDAVRAGRITITNGPLLRPTADGQLPGHVFALPDGETAEYEIGLTLSTREPISYLEIIKNGRIFRTVRLDEYAKSGRLPPVPFDAGGWFLVRAVTETPGNYRAAMTGPFYVEARYERRISRQAVQFFLDWVHERARQLTSIDDVQARRDLLAEHRKARDFWQDLLSKANTP
ncbi:MAG: hypothetical protein JW719_05875 [Pirellulales bacterium]|nr:hypothetical protein [Pirellulales bacterium]